MLKKRKFTIQIVGLLLVFVSIASIPIRVRIYRDESSNQKSECVGLTDEKCKSFVLPVKEYRDYKLEELDQDQKERHARQK